MRKVLVSIILSIMLCSNVFAKTVDSNYYTVLFIGVDARGNRLSGNTDVMLLASYNKTNYEVSLVSLQRDTWIKDLNGEWCKINSIYQRDGIDSLTKVINKSYNVNITNHVIVNWNKVKYVIDKLGSVDVSLTEKEFYYINAYIHETALACGEVDPAKYYVERNVTKLKGIQAVAYARLRLPDSDRKRMERQQKVLKSLLDNYMSLGFLDKIKLVKDFTTNIKTDFGPSEILKVTTASKIKIVNTAISPDLSNYCVLHSISSWACMPKSWPMESAKVLKVLYNRYKTATEYINDLEKESRGLRK